MVKLLCILLFFSTAFSQSSSIGIKGFGETMLSFDAASTALGDSKFFSGNSNSISFSSVVPVSRNANARIIQIVKSVTTSRLTLGFFEEKI